jgi:hypothetical protein
MSLGSNSYVWLFLAVILAGYALYRVGALSLMGFIGLPFLQIIGVVVIVIFAFLIIFIGIKVLLRGGWY